MDRISIAGLEVWAYHGLLPHERDLGQRFVIDVDLDVDLAEAAETDDLAKTVDYGEVAEQVAEVVTARNYRLIETVADRVATLCLGFPRVEAVEVTVHKPSVPLTVAAMEVAVHLRREAS